MFPANVGPLLIGSRKVDQRAARRRTKSRKVTEESRHRLPQQRQPE